MYCSVPGCREIANPGKKNCSYNAMYARVQTRIGRCKDKQKKLQLITQRNNLKFIGKKKFNKLGFAEAETSTLTTEEGKNFCIFKETELSTPNGSVLKKRLRLSYFFSTNKYTIPVGNGQQIKNIFSKSFSDKEDYGNSSSSSQQEKSVYVIRVVDTAFVKLGFSGNVARRLCQLQTGCPLKIQLEFTWKTPDFFAMESWLHTYFSDYHIRGEWFTLPAPVDWTPIFHQFTISYTN
jgi:hypothetical protein